MAIRKGMWTTIKPVPRKTKTAGKKKKNGKKKKAKATIAETKNLAAAPVVAKGTTMITEASLPISPPQASVPVSPTQSMEDASSTTPLSMPDSTTTTPEVVAA
mmetsp:Transcript_12063/g.19025  ORF Transcript_12063/g.19025 Transcript_12063/m.19025 type:complete len:103 (-) Transcript_12063:177-485(-)|eukprot:CAMPEP_0117042054 /NCGR_PEP_ID=MMETSP0472-20121206/29315_1 /TAXON_ID=693140 ORGANISM="Tiarina fusus, Strain LIS" /NCGR_SAMPLE_ID=MMETSP0472 /ASSEMBLY_ACC=CAM_ASM_000603 /LENGTH=102 /DNA_ID=CAMNT_0004753201 /DNA_START=332 /DNA_END=640 /DNA_ORIENTATION=-